MRKAQKKQAEEFVELLGQVHDEIRKAVDAKNYGLAMSLLEQCQEGAIKLGNLIELTEGEGFITIPLLEDYCELIYIIHEEIGQSQSVNENQVYKSLRKSLIQIENSVKNDIRVRLEVVFLPYKASMWDSLESVWKAADEDENCDAYVVPIPYYDRNPDGSFGKFHYEGAKMPKYVPITYYNDYDLEKRKPDIIYIHNPYDNYNLVTSVDPRFYSFELKKYADLLVYIPYYSTSGGMSEGQLRCSAYYHADYIIMQAEQYRTYFDPDLPQDKLQPLGSPKFDRIIRICNNPPEPPAEWKDKMAGKKVYFYNTSIGGMLANTDAFIKKIDYVFKCFKNKKDACLLWRPHPLLESTFNSMRPQYKAAFDLLKNYFLENKLGIYDDTPDITDTIALCDAYIGDAGTSVTSLFGIAGKPIFILDNNISDLPDTEDWRGEIIRNFPLYGSHQWMITQGNKLYASPDNNYKYKYCCDVSEYASADYYSQVFHIGEKDYVCPINGQDIIVIKNNKIEKRIVLNQYTVHEGAFCGAASCGKYLFLIPNRYPAIVRYDTESCQVQYFNNYSDVFIGSINNERRVGGYCVYRDYLLIASPVDKRILAIDIETGKEQLLMTGASGTGGCMMLISDGIDLWLLPYSGNTVTRWNPVSGETHEYTDFPDGFKCIHTLYGYECKERPFSWAAFCGENVYLSPFWANMYIRINKHTGKITEWKPAFEEPKTIKNGYFISGSRSYFIRPSGHYDGKGYLLFSVLDRKLYDVNLETGEYEEIPVEFDMKELAENTAGFKEDSQWLKYACVENSFNTLSDFIDGNITGNQFDINRQMQAYGEITANCDGTSGEKIHHFMCSKLLK